MLKRRLLHFLLYIFFFGAIFGISKTIAVNNNVNGRELPIYSVETDKKQIALTFDSAWGNEDLDTILKILDTYHVKASFFLTGDFVSRYPNEILKIQKAGHDLANHGTNHKNMSQLSKEECLYEMTETHKRVLELTGISMNLFRPPSGDYDNDVITTATEAGYYSIQWSVDSLDWKDYGAENIIQTVTQHQALGNGAIILLHNGSKYTAEALPSLIQILQAQGYQFVPVSELIYKDNYYLDVTGRQFSSK